MIAIQISARASLGFAFASYASELWYVFQVRVSFHAYVLRFVGAPDDVMDCIGSFYNYKSKFK